MSYGEQKPKPEEVALTKKRWRRSLVLATASATAAAGVFAYQTLSPAAAAELRGSSAAQHQVLEAFHRAPPIRLSPSTEPERDLPTLGLDGPAMAAAAADLQQDAVRIYPVALRDWAAIDGDKVALKTGAHYSEHVLTSTDHIVLVLVPVHAQFIELVALATGWSPKAIATPAITGAGGHTIQLPFMRAGDIARVPVALE